MSPNGVTVSSFVLWYGTAPWRRSWLRSTSDRPRAGEPKLRILCLSARGATNGGAPGTVPSVRPSLELGARSWLSGAAATAPAAAAGTIPPVRPSLECGARRGLGGTGTKGFSGRRADCCEKGFSGRFEWWCNKLCSSTMAIAGIVGCCSVLATRPYDPLEVLGWLERHASISSSWTGVVVRLRRRRRARQQKSTPSNRPSRIKPITTHTTIMMVFRRFIPEPDDAAAADVAAAEVAAAAAAELDDDVGVAIDEVDEAEEAEVDSAARLELI